MTVKRMNQNMIVTCKLAAPTALMGSPLGCIVSQSFQQEQNVPHQVLTVHFNRVHDDTPNTAPKTKIIGFVTATAPSSASLQHFAAHVGDVEAIEALVVRGGNLSARAGLKGETPLHIAAGYADSRAVKELIQRWEADETALDARGQSAHDIAGHLIYNFDRGHRHEEEVQLIRTILENAPAEKKWMRRRAGVMLVTRERQRFSRERLRLAESGAKKRGAQGGDGVPDVIAAAPPVAVVNGGSVAKEEAATPTTQFVEGGEGEGGGGGLLSPGMVLFRDAVLRLAEMDDEGIFRTVIGFL